MKFTCRTKELAAALETVTRALSAEAAKKLPVLGAVLIVAGEKRITLKCTDLVLGIETSIPATVEREGRSAIPGSSFNVIVRSLPDGDVTVEVGRDWLVTISMPGTRSRLSVMEARDYPELPEVKPEKSLMLPCGALRKLIKQTVFAASEDESRPILTGTLTEVVPNACRMVACNGFCLAISNTLYEGEAAGQIAVVPAKILNKVAAAIPDSQLGAHIQCSSSHVSFSFGDTRYVMRLLEGGYMRYAQLIRKEHRTRVTVSCESMRAAIDRLMLIAFSERRTFVRLIVSPDVRDNITLHAKNVPGEIYEEVSITNIEGEGLEIRFNPDLLRDVFRAIESDTAVMEFGTPLESCHIAAGDQEFLVLPIKESESKAK